MATSPAEPIDTLPTSTGSAASPIDLCNAIKCALQCESECGWSRPKQLCVTGFETTQGERDDRLGNCSRLEKKKASSADDDGDGDGDGGGGGDSSDSSSSIILAGLGGAFFVLLATGAAYHLCRSSDAARDPNGREPDDAPAPPAPRAVGTPRHAIQIGGESSRIYETIVDDLYDDVTDVIEVAAARFEDEPATTYTSAAAAVEHGGASVNLQFEPLPAIPGQRQPRTGGMVDPAAQRPAPDHRPSAESLKRGTEMAARPGLRLSRDGRGLQARSVKRANPLFSLVDDTAPLDLLELRAGNAFPALSPALHSGASVRSMGNEAVFMFGGSSRTDSGEGVPRHTSDV